MPYGMADVTMSMYATPYDLFVIIKSNIGAETGCSSLKKASKKLHYSKSSEVSVVNMFIIDL